jgi:hypothetical protein
LNSDSQPDSTPRQKALRQRSAFCISNLPPKEAARENRGSNGAITQEKARRDKAFSARYKRFHEKLG